MKTRYILYPLLALMAILLPTSCSTEEDFMDSSITSNGDKVTLTLGVSVPGATNVESRAFGNENYNFDNLFVAVFEQASDGNYYYQGATEVSPVGTDHGCSTYKVTLTATNNPCRLHIIANYPDLSMGFDDEGESIGRLKTKADDLSHDVYWNFVDLPYIKAPANDEETETAAEGDEEEFDIIGALQHVPLVRNYAKVELDVPELENFEFKGYRVYNMPTVGTVAAYNPNGFVDFVGNSYADLAANYLGNEPYQVGLNNADDFTTEPTYMYERKNTDSNGQLLSNAAFIIVKGELNGNTYYYKLDFVDSENKPYNLLRNFVYTMTVTGVNGPGYATEADAMAQPAGNNLNASAAVKDFTNISNGTEQLFVSTTSLMITKDKKYYLYYKYISSLSEGRIANGSVTITGGGAGNVLQTSENATTGGTGEYAGWGMVTLTPKALPAGTQSQVLTFTAGNLQRTVTLTAQQPSDEMSVSLNPASVAMQSEQDVAVNISLPAALGDSPSLFPLRMFIYSEDNTLYATSLPVEIRDGKYGFIREITLKDFQDADIVTDKNGNNFKVFSSAFKTNCANSATKVWVEHDYFQSKSADLEIEKVKTITISNDWTVDIEGREFSEYNGEVLPWEIYNDGRNNGTKTVTVTFNGETKTITINSSKVTSDDITFTNNEGFDDNAVLTFTFTDQYCTGAEFDYREWEWSYSWSGERNLATYTATCTVADLLSGNVKLNFTTDAY